MGKLYKLTAQNGYTRFGKSNQCLWSEGVTNKASNPVRKGFTPQLCTSNLIHAYENPLIAVVMNPIHGDFKNPILWEAKGWVKVRDSQLKCGCESLTTVKKLPLPEITINQRVYFAILCTLQVFKDEKFTLWAKNWLENKERTYKFVDTAYVAANATYAATNAAYAAYAADVAANAAYVAANAAYAATNAAYAATNAAAYAANAAAYAANAANKINFISLIKQAIKNEN